MAIYFGFAAIVVVCTAAIVFVLWQKMAVDRLKLKMDLYDRRYAALMALGDAVDMIGGPIVADEFGLKGMAPPVMTTAAGTLAVARQDPGIPGEVILSFKFLFDENVFAQVLKINDLALLADDGERAAHKRLHTACAKLIDKIEREMKVN